MERRGGEECVTLDRVHCRRRAPGDAHTFRHEETGWTEPTGAGTRRAAIEHLQTQIIVEFAFANADRVQLTTYRHMSVTPSAMPTR
jgi:hypothetical protein